MTDLTEIVRIQSYLREIARSQYETLELAPFTLFFHPTDSLKYFNYAIPDRPCGAGLSGILSTLRHEYHRRQRTARFEFFEAFAPVLPAALRANGFKEEGRQWGMICTSQTLQVVPAVPGCSMVELGPDSSLTDARDFMLVQREAFSPEETSAPTDADVLRAQRSFARRPGFLARLGDEPVGAAAFSQPIDGVTEVTGIATRAAYRRRGIAAALTALAVTSALRRGVQTVCLVAEDERAGRVYQRVGFRPFSIMLAYIEDSISQ